ncbi:MAG: ThuA domain-containing protein [Planctomycetes bacterium]|nr:ThuA domain-containing protein [Planctomycetota bacterium]
MWKKNRWALALAVLISCVSAASAGDKKIRVVIIDGWNNHQWPLTTPIMKKALEASGRFTVDISTSPKRNQTNLIPPDWKSGPFPPDLTKYDVVLSNYNGPSWPKELNESLDSRLKDGKIALVIVHAANNSFGGWSDFRRMIGMGWYGAGTGDRLLLDDQGKRVIIPKGKGQGPGHRYTGKFTVTIRDPKHPITKGMPSDWLHNDDELYDNMRGPIEDVHLLATAYSKGTKVHEPMIWTVSYRKGRVFHTPMGHAVNAMRCVGFQATLNRGTEWAATGNVTLALPDNFPTENRVSVVK